MFSLTSALTKPASRLKPFVRDLLLSDGEIIERQYWSRTGRKLSLSDPRDLSEKVQWLKLHDRSPLHGVCADKIAARDYVRLRLGSEGLVPLIRVTADPGEIDPGTIREERFVVKTNHDQGGVFLCRDRAAFDWKAAQIEVGRRLKINKYYEFREHQYRGIKPRILVEKLIEGEFDEEVRELKVFCFHGAPCFVQLKTNRFSNRSEAFYDLEWTRLACVGRWTGVEGEAPRPQRLREALDSAATLASPFLFARIDFLEGSGGRLWFSEVTFHPGAGLMRFEPPAFERAFGDMLDLSRLPETRPLQEAALLALAARPAATWLRSLRASGR